MQLTRPPFSNNERKNSEDMKRHAAHNFLKKCGIILTRGGYKSLTVYLKKNYINDNNKNTEVLP
jgi:hypothetical protein